MPLSVETERRLLAELFRLAAERDEAERRRKTDYEARGQCAVQEFRDAQQSITKRFRTDKESTERQFNTLRSLAVNEADAQVTEARVRFDNLERNLLAEFADAHDTAKKQYETQTWEAGAIFENQQKGPKELIETTESQVRDYRQHMEALVHQAREHLRMCRFARVADMPPPEPPDIPPTDSASQLQTALEQTSQLVSRLGRLAIPPLFASGRLTVIYLPLLIAAIAPVLLFFQLERLDLLIGALGMAVVVCLLLTVWLRKIARRNVSEIYSAILSNHVAAEAAGTQLSIDVRKHAQQEQRRLVQERDRELQSAKRAYTQQRDQLVADRDKGLSEARQRKEQITRKATATREETLRMAESKFPPLLEEIQTTYRKDLADAQARFDNAKSDNETQFARDWNQLASRWREGVKQVLAQLSELSHDSESLFPAWDDNAWDSWKPASAAPGAIRFGDLAVDLRAIPGGISAEPVLNEGIPPAINLPALLDFPRAGSLLIQAAGSGREVGIDLLQAVMLRMLTTIPPGKVRFTIIDPVGLGENFAGFMHLADYDDVLVTSRIWTEPAHIEQRLADLTEQMENIIQKYLRNEYKTIEEYNAQAGEVAEAFRILVVANFPANFSETAARRLVSIASSGARCGVYTMLLVDANQPMPPGFDLNDVAPFCTCLLWRDGQFVWRDADFRPFTLTVDQTPEEDRFTRIVHMAGESAKDSRRVEVPFEYIAPAENMIWTASTKHGLDVPLGRAGATKLQRLRLGQGTSQHVLVAGKTGSGKSTLLHALITNMALLYSPDEVELYLIDFKKGVEFKTYASHDLPHARVVAIESEREFGLSVLERLDAELRRRGDLFRAAGVQDLAAHRDTNGSSVLPRILLVIDEFHELFVEDDKIAQDCALLLDRLVRQGRAFGIHVLLGSQTLGGAYSLARSTMGQMGVRIALQCSEADAHLILSEENTAARLLSRPGEAIYNDAGGLLEGNNPFQVVWLSEERREKYLSKVRALAARGKVKHPRQIVFEGNLPADIGRNVVLAEHFANPAWDAHVAACTAWLGEAVAIKEPTAAIFRRENGCNLLMVGQREESATAMMATVLLSAAAQYAPAESLATGHGSRFYVFENPRPDRDLSHTVGSLAESVPHSVRAVPRRQIAEAFDELALELDRRQSDDSGNDPDVYIFINDLGRFRDLRRDENDLGFSFSNEEKRLTPDKQFARILREGPSVGIFTIIWCDTLGNLNRAIDRQGLREFDMRVLFQMSQNDSSYLADTPAASRLGPQLAMLFNEQTGVAEKFRPYAWPAAEWLTWVSERLKPRATAPQEPPIADSEQSAAI